MICDNKYCPIKFEETKEPCKSCKHCIGDLPPELDKLFKIFWSNDDE